MINGVRLVKFAMSKNLVVKSKMFPQLSINKYTWTSSDGPKHNQIDHVLIDRRRHSSILDVQSFKGADCDTDHNLVVAKIMERLAVSKRPANKMNINIFNVNKLNVGDVK
jgi:predicted Zn-dependent protease